MKTLYDWSARRAGAGITITHSTGKITGVDSVCVEDGIVVACKGDERYALVILS